MTFHKEYMIRKENTTGQQVFKESNLERELQI